MIRFLIANLLIVCLLVSCTKDADVEFETPSLMVVNSFFSADSIFKVNITESISLFDNFEEQYTREIIASMSAAERFSTIERADIRNIDDARVELYEEGHKIGAMSYTANGNYTMDYKPKALKEYTVKAFSPKGYAVEAKNAIPEGAQIISIDTASQNTSYYLKCKLTFKDNPNSRDFYFLEVRTIAGFYNHTSYNNDQTVQYTTDTVYYEHSIDLECTDDIIEQKVETNGITYGLTFSDKLINGMQKELTITLSKSAINAIENNVIKFYLKTISEDYYLYAKTYGKLLSQEEDMFAEPVNVYSNIKNGFGIFGGYAQSVDSITYNGSKRSWW